MSLTKVNYRMSEGDDLDIGSYNISRNSQFGLVVRQETANISAYINAAPNGTIVPNTPAALFRVYGTDIIADSVNFESCDFESYTQSDPGYFIKTRKGGTGEHRPVTFAIGGARLMRFDPVTFGTSTCSNALADFIFDGCAKGDLSIGIFGRSIRTEDNTHTTTYPLISGVGSNDVGIGSSDTDVRIISGVIEYDGNPVGGTEVTIADDAVASITPPRTGGFMYVTCNGDDAAPQLAFCGQIFYDVGSSLAIEKGSAFSTIGSQLLTSTSDVTGTTGATSRVTVAVQTDVIKIENRSGSSKTFQVTFQ